VRPTSLPVARQGGGNGGGGTAAHEQHTSQPSASWETVTVVGEPARGRDQRTALRPLVARTRSPLARRAPWPSSLSVQEWSRAPLKARATRLLAPLHPPEAGWIRRGAAGQHVVEHVALAGGIVGARGAPRLQLRFLLSARDRDAALFPPEEALLQGGLGARTAAPPDARPRPLLCGRGRELLLIGFAARRLFAQRGGFPPASAHSGGHQDRWLTPRAPHRLG
jgi:hypothetical protein